MQALATRNRGRGTGQGNATTAIHQAQRARRREQTTHACGEEDIAAEHADDNDNDHGCQLGKGKRRQRVEIDDARQQGQEEHHRLGIAEVEREPCQEQLLRSLGISVACRGRTGAVQSL